MIYFIQDPSTTHITVAMADLPARAWAEPWRGSRGAPSTRMGNRTERPLERA